MSSIIGLIIGACMGYGIVYKLSYLNNGYMCNALLLLLVPLLSMYTGFAIEEVFLNNHFEVTKMGSAAFLSSIYSEVIAFRKKGRNATSKIKNPWSRAEIINYDDSVTSTSRKSKDWSRSIVNFFAALISLGWSGSIFMPDKIDADSPSYLLPLVICFSFSVLGWKGSYLLVEKIKQQSLLSCKESLLVWSLPLIYFISFTFLAIVLPSILQWSLR